MAHPCCLCGGECYCAGDIDDSVVFLTPPICESCGCEEDADGDDDYDPNEVYDGAIGPEDICRECGCHSAMACLHPTQGPCWWVKPATFDEQGYMTEGPLCSHCFHQYEHVHRPWQQDDNQL